MQVAQLRCKLPPDFVIRITARPSLSLDRLSLLSVLSLACLLPRSQYTTPFPSDPMPTPPAVASALTRLTTRLLVDLSLALSHLRSLTPTVHCPALSSTHSLTLSALQPCPPLPARSLLPRRLPAPARRRSSSRARHLLSRFNAWFVPHARNASTLAHSLARPHNDLRRPTSFVRRVSRRRRPRAPLTSKLNF